MSEQTLVVRGITTHYRQIGSGPALFILHGWGGSSDSWTKVQDLLARQGYTVICPDFPGFGKSKSPLEAWDVSHYAEWFSVLMEVLKIDTCLLVAHSFGGRVAIKFAVKHPKKIKKLILCSSAGIKPDPVLKTKIILWLVKMGKRTVHMPFLRRFEVEAAKLVLLFLPKSDYVNAKGVMKETMKKVIAEDLLPYLSGITTKTLLIWGENDRMVPLKYGHMFQKHISHSKLKILPRMGHSPHLKIPEELSRIMTRFFQLQ